MGKTLFVPNPFQELILQWSCQRYLLDAEHFQLHEFSPQIQGIVIQRLCLMLSIFSEESSLVIS